MEEWSGLALKKKRIFLLTDVWLCINCGDIHGSNVGWAFWRSVLGAGSIHLHSSVGSAQDNDSFDYSRGFIQSEGSNENSAIPL